MEKFISGEKLIKDFGWKIFQYFGYMKKGLLQPHDPVRGYRIIDPDTEHGKGVIASFEQSPPKTLEEYEEILRIDSIRAWEIHRRQEIFMKSGKMKNTVSEKKIREEARIVYDHHLMELNGCIKKSFTLSRYKEEDSKQLIEAEKWLFKTADVLAFEKKHGLKRAEKHIAITQPEPINKQQDFIKRKKRPSQIAKIECRKVAQKLWDMDPSITIADMI